MIPHDYVELVHKTAMMFAARRNHATRGHDCDRQLGDRMEAEVKDLLDAIRNQWAGEDAAAGVVAGLCTDDEPGRPWPGPHGIPTRAPGRSVVEALVGQMAEVVLRLRRLPNGPPPLTGQVMAWIILLTGWTSGDLDRFLAHLQASVHGPVRASVPAGREGGAS